MATTFDITAISLFAFALILMIFNCGPTYRSENAKFLEKITKYQASPNDAEKNKD